MKNRIISLLSDKHSVGFLGIGKTNKEILSILSNCDFTPEIRLRQRNHDVPNEYKKLNRVNLFLGDNERNSIDEDVLFVSPSVRREMLDTSPSTIVTSDIDIFFKEKHNNCFLISGSDGKSTVTTLVSEFLNERFQNKFTGGNLGTPLATCNLSKADAFIIEISSFALRYITPQSKRAIITNITPNHLDWHESYEEYVESKSNILKLCDEPIINVDTPECARLAKHRNLYAVCSSLQSHDELKAIYHAEHTVTVSDGIYADGRKIAGFDDITLEGAHNYANIASAIAMTLELSDASTVRNVLHSFSGLAHRCERFLTADGIYFVDSSIDTTPQRTVATLNSLKKRVRILLGGKGKGLSLQPLKEPLIKFAEKISIYGETCEEFIKFIENDSTLSNIPHRCFSRFEDAVDYLISGMRLGDTALLSPAATSYGEFKNYEERSERFKEIIFKKYPKI